MGEPKNNLIRNKIGAPSALSALSAPSPCSALTIEGIECTEFTERTQCKAKFQGACVVVVMKPVVVEVTGCGCGFKI